MPRKKPTHAAELKEAAQRIANLTAKLEERSAQYNAAIERLKEKNALLDVMASREEIERVVLILDSHAAVRASTAKLSSDFGYRDASIMAIHTFRHAADIVRGMLIKLQKESADKQKA